MFHTAIFYILCLPILENIIKLGNNAMHVCRLKSRVKQEIEITLLGNVILILQACSFWTTQKRERCHSSSDLHSQWKWFIAGISPNSSWMSANATDSFNLMPFIYPGLENEVPHIFYFSENIFQNGNVLVWLVASLSWMCMDIPVT